jgi:hypothetical protein
MPRVPRMPAKSAHVTHRAGRALGYGLAAYLVVCVGWMRPGSLVVKGSSPSSAGRHTGVQMRPAAGPRCVVDETFGC